MRALLLLLLACPSETPEEPGLAAGGAGEVPVGAVAPPPEGAPPSGAEGAGAAGGGGDPAAMGMPLPVLDVKPGEGVKLSGKAEFDGSVSGSIRLDVLKRNDPMPELVHSATLTALGTFEVEVPKNYGSVQVAVFVDENGDGPSPGEPMAATTWIEVKEAPVADLSLVLHKLDPGTAPGAPMDAGAPPAGGAPPGGALVAPGAPPAAGAPPAGAPPAAGAAPTTPG